MAICIEHRNPFLPTTRRLHDDMEAAVEAVCKSSHEPAEDVREGLASQDGFILGHDVWIVIPDGVLREEDLE